MLIADYDYDTDIRVKKQEAYEEGVSAGITQGIAQQKAEDEKLFVEERSKFADITSQKDAEIAALKMQLAEALKKQS